MSKSSITTTNPDWLHNAHAGELLVSELMEPIGLTEGFFLRLQDQYELLEAKRALNGALDRIVPRAA